MGAIGRISASVMNLLAFFSTREEPRYRTERLKQIVASLPPTIIINPLAATVLFIPLWFWGNAFGHVPVSHLVAAVAMHVVLSSITWFIWRRDKPDVVNEDRSETQLIALQCVLSVAWGITGWLYW